MVDLIDEKNLFIILLNLDQSDCAVSSIFSFGGHFVQQSRTAWTSLVEGLIRNICVILF